MKVYTVRILDTVFADIGDIADYIVAVSTPEHAAKYARQLQAEQWCEAVLQCCKCVLQWMRFAVVRGHFAAVQRPMQWCETDLHDCKRVLQWCEAKLHGNGKFSPPRGQ